MTYFEKDAILSGIGISRIGRRTGIPGFELTMEAVRAAIADAGLVARDVDGIATLGDTPAGEVNAALHIEAADCGSGFGTGGLLSPVMSACRAVAERRARHVVIYRTIQMLGGTVPVKREENAPAPPLARMFEAPEGAPRPAVGAMDDVNDLVAAQAYSAANWLALNCRRHMELYGTTKKQLGWLALNGRRNAALNPLAVYREPMTMADYLGARPVSTPFGLLDCDVPIDGSIAVVVSSVEYASDSVITPARVVPSGSIARSTSSHTALECGQRLQRCVSSASASGTESTVTTRRSAHGSSVSVKVAALSQYSFDNGPKATITPGGGPKSSSAPVSGASDRLTTRNTGHTEYFSISAFL